MKRVSVYDAKTQLSALLDEVASGREVLIMRRNVPIAKLVAIAPKTKKRLLGSAKGEIRLAADFDAPLDEFAEYRE